MPWYPFYQASASFRIPFRKRHGRFPEIGFKLHECYIFLQHRLLKTKDTRTHRAHFRITDGEGNLLWFTISLRQSDSEGGPMIHMAWSCTDSSHRGGPRRKRRSTLQHLTGVMGRSLWWGCFPLRWGNRVCRRNFWRRLIHHETRRRSSAITHYGLGQNRGSSHW